MLYERNVNVHKDLEESFLYKNDPDALHLLLSLLDNESYYINVKPKYKLARNVLSVLNKEFSSRGDLDRLIDTFKKILAEDLNRIEMALYIKGYEWGYRSNRWPDMLERIALNKLSMDTLYYDQFLFHKSKDPEVLNVKQEVFTIINRNEKGNSYMKRIVEAYMRELVKGKFLKFNDFFDRQLLMDFDDPEGSIKEEEQLTEYELKRAYKKVSCYTYKNILTIFKQAAWNGINDAVLSRYR